MYSGRPLRLHCSAPAGHSGPLFLRTGVPAGAAWRGAPPGLAVVRSAAPRRSAQAPCGPGLQRRQRRCCRGFPHPRAALLSDRNLDGRGLVGLPGAGGCPPGGGPASFLLAPPGFAPGPWDPHGGGLRRCGGAGAAQAPPFPFGYSLTERDQARRYQAAWFPRGICFGSR